MTVVPIPAFFDNYIWALLDEEHNLFDCVDPGDAQPVLEFARDKKLNLRSILLTHHHYDHIGGVSELIKAYPSCKVYGPTDNRIPDVDHTVTEHQTVHIGHYVFTILFNPGHTSSHISYYEPNQEWLFCGDTLFSAGCGRVFDGTLEQLYHSLKLFKSLPSSTKIFCAHEYTKQNLRFAQSVEPNNSNINTYLQQFEAHLIRCSLPSTLSQELKINPFLRTDKLEIQKYALAHGAQSTQELELFRVLREKKNSFK